MQRAHETILKKCCQIGNSLSSLKLLDFEEAGVEAVHGFEVDAVFGEESSLDWFSNQAAHP